MRETFTNPVVFVLYTTDSICGKRLNINVLFSLHFGRQDRYTKNEEVMVIIPDLTQGFKYTIWEFDVMNSFTVINFYSKIFSTNAILLRKSHSGWTDRRNLPFLFYGPLDTCLPIYSYNSSVVLRSVGSSFHTFVWAGDPRGVL